ncbi:hypothetical protein GCM10018779_07930 [Streptomyces griseocarneus]|nr:hypothetical protein GCM10018779_07930 [Streptomyces griseocarneus]
MGSTERGRFRITGKAGTLHRYRRALLHASSAQIDVPRREILFEVLGAQNKYTFEKVYYKEGVTQKCSRLS